MTNIPQSPPNDNTPEAGGPIDRLAIITALEGCLIQLPNGDWTPVHNGHVRTRYGAYQLRNYEIGQLETMLRQSRPAPITAPAGMGKQCDAFHPNGSGQLSQCQKEATSRIVYQCGNDPKCVKRCQACAEALVAANNILRQEAL